MSRRLLVGSGAAALALLVAAPTSAFAAVTDDHGSSDGHSSAKGPDGHNPPGNNGTIKIDYPAPADSGHANRPHPGCAFQLRMFGFDDDQTGTITFVGQAPTKLGTLLTQAGVLLSNDPAGGGQDVDEAYSYTASQLGLLGTPQAKQGWHVKVSVDADNAPGGAKQKVFWLKCDEAPAAGSATTSSSGTTQGAATVTAKSLQTAGGAAAGALRAAAVGGTTAGAATAATTAGTGGEAAATTAASPAASATRGSALPFTGLAFQLGTMLLIALAAVAAGGLAIRAGRRRTATRL